MVINCVEAKLKPSDIPTNESKKDDPKPSIVYGVITAKDVAKYRPPIPQVKMHTKYTFCTLFIWDKKKHFITFG